jgi:hypothetical protein
VGKRMRWNNAGRFITCHTTVAVFPQSLPYTAASMAEVLAKIS